MSTLIEVNGLVVSRGKRIVLDVDSLGIDQSKVLAIIGPNGAGKSSLLLALAKILKPHRGEIKFCDDPSLQMTDLQYRRQIALVMQDSLLLDDNVYNNIAIGLRFRGVVKDDEIKAVSFWAEKFNITHLLDRSGRMISGGESQRVSLARAFVLNPKLLLLDEPFSSLDPLTRQDILQDLKNILAEAKIATVFVTHDIGDAALLADDIAVIWDGKLAQFGSREQVFRQPANKAIQKYLGNFYDLESNRH